MTYMTIIAWIAIQFDLVIYVALMMNYNNFGGLLSFHLVSSSAQNFNLANTWVCDRRLAKLMTFASAGALLCVLCLTNVVNVVLSKC